MWPLVGQPAVNATHRVPFVHLISNSQPKAFCTCLSQNILLVESVLGGLDSVLGLDSGLGVGEHMSAVPALMGALGIVRSFLDLFLETFFSVLKAGHVQ